MTGKTKKLIWKQMANGMQSLESTDQDKPVLPKTKEKLWCGEEVVNVGRWIHGQHVYQRDTIALFVKNKSGQIGAIIGPDHSLGDGICDVNGRLIGRVTRVCRPAESMSVVDLWHASPGISQLSCCLVTIENFTPVNAYRTSNLHHTWKLGSPELGQEAYVIDRGQRREGLITATDLSVSIYGNWFSGLFCVTWISFPTEKPPFAVVFSKESGQPVGLLQAQADANAFCANLVTVLSQLKVEIL